MSGPVERKVQASSAAAAVSGLAVWVLGQYVFKTGGVPDVIVSWIYVLVPGIITFAAGYITRHSPAEIQALTTAPPPAVPPASPPAGP